MIESISAKDLCFSYGTKKILENLSFELIQPVACLNAENGGGKSTLLRLLCGSLSPTSGELLLNGSSVSSFTFEDWTQYRLKIGFGFDFGGLLSNRTLFENLALPLQYHSLFPADDLEREVETMLGKFELMSQRNARPSEVTGSQRKAACVARALIMNPELLLLDDPTTGLKPSMKKTLCREVNERLENRTLKFFIYASEDDDFHRQFSSQEILCHSRPAEAA